jgi:hypothetical protein
VRGKTAARKSVSPATDETSLQSHFLAEASKVSRTVIEGTFP